MQMQSVFTGNMCRPCFTRRRSTVRVCQSPPHLRNPNFVPIGSGFGFFTFFEGISHKRKRQEVTEPVASCLYYVTSVFPLISVRPSTLPVPAFPPRFPSISGSSAACVGYAFDGVIRDFHAAFFGRSFHSVSFPAVSFNFQGSWEKFVLTEQPPALPAPVSFGVFDPPCAPAQAPDRCECVSPPKAAWLQRTAASFLSVPPRILASCPQAPFSTARSEVLRPS
jgi:hypothetical protein